MKILIEIDLDNDAFWISEEVRDLKEAQRILSDVGSMLRGYEDFGNPNLTLKDINGNTVGFFKLVDDQGRLHS